MALTRFAGFAYSYSCGAQQLVWYYTNWLAINAATTTAL